MDNLWEVISEPPIYNSITVYGTYMLPVKAILETRCSLFCQ